MKDDLDALLGGMRDSLARQRDWLSRLKALRLRAQQEKRWRSLAVLRIAEDRAEMLYEGARSLAETLEEQAEGLAGEARA